MDDASRLLVASADGHVGPPTAAYRPYVDPTYRADFDDFVATHRYRWTAERPESLFVATARDRQRASERFDAGITSLTDPVQRLRELDQDGVAAEILFPDDQSGNTPGWLAGVAPQAFDRTYAPHLRLAGARAYNRWLAEFCASDPARLVGTILLGSLDDVGAAVAEVRRAHRSGLDKSVFLPLDYYLPLYHHERYEPFWATCEELDLVVSIHGSDGGPSWYGDGARGSAIYLAEIGFYARRPLWCLIFGGVFERHPNLRVAFTEQGSNWVRPLLDQLDRTAASTLMRWTTDDPLPCRPSEYFARHCAIGNSLLQRSDIAERADVGVANLMWGSDFPHYEGSWPNTRGSMRALFDGTPRDDATAIVGENLAAFYRLDERVLRRTAERIGPTAEELGLVDA
jgi:predicted TIM-barrel fold metal-dependent hydrolase